MRGHLSSLIDDALREKGSGHARLGTGASSVDTARRKRSSYVMKILVLKISVRRTKIFSINIGPPDHFFQKILSPSENFGPFDLMVKN